MKNFENFINNVLPTVSEEDMVIAINVLVKECNEDSKQTAIKDPLHQQMKEVWMQLQHDVFEYGFMAEFAEFILENPDLNIFELDRQFRNEYDI